MTNEKNKQYIIGFDFGGTKLLAVVLDNKFSIISTARQKLPGNLTTKILIPSLESTINEALKAANLTMDNISGIGIGVPSPVNHHTGIMMSPPNLGIGDINLGRAFKPFYKGPVIVDNDVNAGLFGEFKLGAARGFKHIVGLYSGTGLGGGLILNGNLFRGASGCAGELGHMIIQAGGPRCGCGQLGCTEALCSRTSVAKDLAALAGFGQAPIIHKHAGTDLRKIRSKVIYNSLKAGEAPVQEVISRSAHYLGIAMANCVNIFNPDLIVLGGGFIDRLGDSYIKEACQSMSTHAISRLVGDVKVVKASLGDYSVAKGAGALVLDHINSRNTKS